MNIFGLTLEDANGDRKSKRQPVNQGLPGK